MKHFYRDVPGLGNVAVSRHAQSRASEDHISEEEFQRVLLSPDTPDVLENQEILWRERAGIRLVILMTPEPFRGARLVKTMFRVEVNEKVK